MQSWNELLEIDRPAVLSLITPERFTAYVVLAGIRGERAFLLLDGKEIETSLAELGALWSGEFIFLWQPPAARREQTPSAAMSGTPMKPAKASSACPDWPYHAIFDEGLA